MPWVYSFEERALKEFSKLDRQGQKDIISYLEQRIATNEDPRRFGKVLRGNLAGLWRYRIGNYRVVCQIQDKLLVVLVITVGHRKNVYN